jgi:hypothetical protein
VLERESILGPMQAAVHNRLTEITRSAEVYDDARLAQVARAEIPLIIAALREALAEHDPDTRGRCRACRSRTPRWPWRRRTRTPCRVYLAAQLRLGQGEAVVASSTSHQKRRKRNPHYVA